MEMQNPQNQSVGVRGLDTLSALSEAQRAIAMERVGLLRPFLEEGVALAEVARTVSVPLRTLERWAGRYRQQGLAGLARKPRSDQGKHRLSEAMQKLVEGLVLQKPAPSLRNVYRQACRVAQQQGETPPS